MFTVGMEMSPPLPLIVPFEAAVEPGAEVEACRRYRLNPVGAHGPVRELGTNCAAKQPAIVVFEPQIRRRRPGRA